jgi:hypothetical protein
MMVQDRRLESLTFAKDSLDESADIEAVAILEDITDWEQCQSLEMNVVVQMGPKVRSQPDEVSGINRSLVRAT